MTSLRELIRTDQPLRTGAMATYPYSKAIEQKYRFTSRFGDLVELFEISKDGKTIDIPRALCPLGKVDARDFGEDVTFHLNMTLRDDQHDWFSETLEFLLAGQSGITSAGTGRGKTALGYYCTAHIGKKTLVVCTKDDIYEKWIKDASKFLGLQAHEIGEIRGDKCQVVGTKFVVAMIHSLSKDAKYPEWITNGFGLVIFDECHRLPADSFSTVAGMFPAAIRLGLSATVERSDGKEIVLHAHIGPTRVTALAELTVPRILRYTTGWTCPRSFKTDKVTGQKIVQRIPHQPGKTTHIEKMLAADIARNHAIEAAVALAFSKGRRIVVFSTLLDHLSTLHRGVVKLGVPGKDIGIYGQATTKAEKAARAKIETRKLLFTTYTMMAEGTDFPWLDTCVLAMPRSNVKQAVGRVRRIWPPPENDHPMQAVYPDKKPPVVMDFVDLDSPVFAGYAQRRGDWYRRINAEILEVE